MTREEREQQPTPPAAAMDDAAASTQPPVRPAAGIHLFQRGDIRRLVIDRPPHNALDISALLALAAALASIAQHHQTRLIVLAGTGEAAFCAGLEPEALQQPAALLPALTELARAFHALATRHIPTVALLHGLSLSIGCELALLCDTRIAREDAILGLPEITRGIFPPLGAVLLPRLIGPRRALHLLLTGERISAREAHKTGLVHQVLPAATFAQEVDELLVMLAACGYQPD